MLRKIVHFYMEMNQVILVFICFNTVLARHDFFGPEFKYDNGEYWGQSYQHEFMEIKIPHGKGTYVSDDKSVKFNGEWRHGEPIRGTRFYKDGRNYTGFFKHSMLHGIGRISYQNGTILEGEFVNGVPCGQLTMTYANGDKRTGFFNQTWIGKAAFVEKGGASNWQEFWQDGRYQAQVQINQSVIDKYQDQVSVELICKVHSQGADGEILKAGVKLASSASNTIQQHGEVATLRFKLDFSDDPFQTYTCLARSRDDQILVQDSKQIRNPFFLMSYGDCGAQLAAENRRKVMTVKRSVTQRVSMGHEQAYHGQVPWQALLWSDLQIRGKNQSMDGFCGGTIISPYHVLTAAHCLKTKKQLGRDLNNTDFTVKLGYNSQPHDPRGRAYKVSRFRIHPEFNDQDPKLHHDIAMITLENRIIIDDFVNPVCLPKAEDFIENNQRLTLSGFGLFYNPLSGRWEKPTFLQMTNDIKKLPMEDCNSGETDFQGYFCAGDGKTFEMNSNQFTADSCQGDSGGPLTYRDPHSGRFNLIGLVSWGSTQCGTTRGSIYVNVTNYLPWIRYVKLMDAVDDYIQTNGQLPYHKMDNGILHEMFHYISKVRQKP